MSLFVGAFGGQLLDSMWGSKFTVEKAAMGQAYRYRYRYRKRITIARLSQKKSFDSLQHLAAEIPIYIPTHQHLALNRQFSSQHNGYEKRCSWN
jgi:hypothetical protein